ncbi:MAG: hypothetical protein JSW67_08350 [Candidatus Latescibacterota bacterium]|nr:MAG: hypothetical protein JSW67_08350 [Candidatus Latescibacterota bacterium]
MPQIELAPEEIEMLRAILESYLSDLRMEISHTDSMDFREGLKKREVFLKKMLRQLEATVEG